MARKKCCICGREMSSFSLNCIPLNVVVGGTRPVECRDCYKIHKYEKLEFYPDGKVVDMGDGIDREAVRGKSREQVIPVLVVLLVL